MTYRECGALVPPLDWCDELSHQKGDFECKFCGTHTAFRSHRKNFLEMLRSRMTCKAPFRCYRCHRRFWAPVDRRDL